METKKSIRQIIRKQRKELDPIIWQSQTAEICRKTCELDVFREATDIYCYIDFGIPASADDGLMIMPGVAFDTNRNRVGYGGGYYDRYLESHPQLHTLALAFDMQVLFEVPAEEQDIKPQLLVTETNIYQEG